MPRKSGGTKAEEPSLGFDASSASGTEALPSEPCSPSEGEEDRGAGAECGQPPSQPDKVVLKGCEHAYLSIGDTVWHLLVEGGRPVLAVEPRGMPYGFDDERLFVETDSGLYEVRVSEAGRPTLIKVGN